MASSTQDMEATLQRASKQLGALADLAAVRGDGAAQFVYAELEQRAIELASSEDRWWLELWADGEVASEHYYPSCDAAVQSAESWLRGNDAT